jgi:type VII secretion effector (TIGR04197 family)
MARIRVNTEDLRTKAKDFESAADAFSRAGDDIAAAAAAMPSYDGQLSGPARKAGYEIQSQARDMKAALSNDAQSLQKTAQAFEEVDNQTQREFLSAQIDIKDAPFSMASTNAGFGHPDDSISYGPFQGIWFTYHRDSWNPFIRGTRGEGFSGDLSNDADKWIGYEEVLADPTKVAIWYNPLPPQPLPNPPYTPRVYDKDDPAVQVFLLAEKNMELTYELVKAYMPDILNSVLDASDILGLIESIGKIGKEALDGIGAVVSTLINVDELVEACKKFDDARTIVEQQGNALFISDVPYESYKPYGDEILTPGPTPSFTPTPEPAPTPGPQTTPTPGAP